MNTLLARITRRTTAPTQAPAVEFDETHGGQVCTRACRATAHRDRTTTAAYRVRL